MLLHRIPAHTHLGNPGYFRSRGKVLCCNSWSELVIDVRLPTTGDTGRKEGLEGGREGGGKARERERDKTHRNGHDGKGHASSGALTRMSKLRDNFCACADEYSCP